MATARRNKSQDNKCTKCFKVVEYMTREEQDAHETECKKQETLL